MADGSNDRVAGALRLGCPVLAAELMLEGKVPGSVMRLRQLRAGRFQISLPSASPVKPRIEEAIGRRVKSLPEDKGVLALALWRHDSDDPCQAAPYWIQPRFSKPGVQAEFAAETARAAEKAAAWLVRRFGLVRLPWDLSFDLLLLGGRGFCGEIQDPASAGLAAALALAYEILDLKLVVAGTGRVDPTGHVEGVGGVTEKLKVLKREAPFVSRVYLPIENRLSHEEERSLGLNLVYVENVQDALDDLADDCRNVRAQYLDPAKAVEEMMRLELANRRESAKALAEQLSSLLKRPRDLTELEELELDVVATATRAIECVHQGRASQGLDLFSKMDQRLEKVPVELRKQVMIPGPKAFVYCTRASNLIDTLDFDEARVLLDRFGGLFDYLESLHRLLYLGTKARVYEALGMLDEAMEHASKACNLHLKTEERFQIPRAMCNLAKILYKKACSRDPGALDELKSVLDEARVQAAEILDDVQKRETTTYIDLNFCRLYSLTGEYEKALNLAGDVCDSNGRFPKHLMFRYAGEALAKAGRTNQAIDLLCSAADSISEQAGPFEKLVLLTSGARAALLAEELGLDSCKEYGEKFLQAFEEYKPGFLSGKANTRREMIAAGLEIIPY